MNRFYLGVFKKNYYKNKIFSSTVIRKCNIDEITKNLKFKAILKADNGEI